MTKIRQVARVPGQLRKSLRFSIIAAVKRLRSGAGQGPGPAQIQIDSCRRNNPVLFRVAPALYNSAIPMNIVLNGETKPFEAPLTVAELLARLGLTGARVAVEVNHEIVPRSRHGERVLSDRDRVEVVRAIGGG